MISMPRIEVEPGQLTGASTQQSSIAGRMAEVGALVGQAASTAAGGAGDGAAASAMSDFGHAWSTLLHALSSSVEGTASNLGAAAGAYSKTDQNAMPMGTGGP